jgi:hypothetical protein
LFAQQGVPIHKCINQWFRRGACCLSDGTQDGRGIVPNRRVPTAQRFDQRRDGHGALAYESAACHLGYLSVLGYADPDPKVFAGANFQQSLGSGPA